ncbi:6-phosphogluconolactonase [Vitreoscilla massiliensis]|uniref:6-phosphogluconolactonase n=1 Tax=Vitreoscilla massiliensis TaxID=1689272 RepID=A0ABY4E0W5_9NEIS|nr:6-phosphogluconolactonase [Vitreoscilla massiliensis]UOO89386.1 6-phosphogluconolactonase [Vitreoscilla massiliensis]
MKKPDKKHLEKWHEFATEAEFNLALASALISQLRDLLSRQNHVLLAVSGGKSPRALMQTLSTADLDWSRVTIQWVDERLLSRGHVNSNSVLIETNLLQHHAAQAQWQPLLPVINPNDAPRELTETERMTVLQAALQAYQRPDVVVLGMGEDGHTASLFAHAEQLAAGIDLDNATPLLLLQPPAAPYWRISMTLAAIVSAKSIYIAAFGAPKRKVLQQAAQQADVNLPISLVLHHSQGIPVHVYC